MTDAPVELLVCVRCRRGHEVADEDTRPGQILHDALVKAAPDSDGLTVRAVACMSNCSQGCTIALRGPGRWSYIYGNVAEDCDPHEILDGAQLYHETPDGLIPWKARPEHFKRNCIARIPPLEIDHD